MCRTFFTLSLQGISDNSLKANESSPKELVLVMHNKLNNSIRTKKAANIAQHNIKNHAKHSIS